MSKFKFFALPDKFTRIAQIFFKFTNVKHNLKKWNIELLFWKKVKKSLRLSAREKIG